MMNQFIPVFHLKINIQILIITTLLTMNSDLFSQDPELPFAQIPPNPEQYNEFTVSARMIDGLGFRYYWATEGLRAEELSYKPADDVRTIGETLEHIRNLSKVIVNALQQQPNDDGDGKPELQQMREATLKNLQQSSEILKQAKSGDMEQYKMIFGRAGKTVEYPFWNMLNGPIEDAVYHTGQVVAFRRAAGNPIPAGVRMLTGTKE
jgi:uncharacterized damage-inducible protein DinB